MMHPAHSNSDSEEAGLKVSVSDALAQMDLTK